jgi:lycopene cyclase domain-containing protein
LQYEYLIFNIIVLIGPVFFGAQKRFYFFNHWRETFISVAAVAIPFLVWDSLVTGLHWDFNSNYIIGIKFFKLPIEEILFFITVPYACIFTWEMVTRHSREGELNYNGLKNIFQFAFIIGGIIFLFLGKGYTGLAFLIFGLAIIFDRKFGANIIGQRKFIFFFVLVSLFTLVFNGYLTWRPVVTYGEQYQLGFRIFTVPFEDFIFGYSLLILNTTIYQKLISLKIFSKEAKTLTSAEKSIS